MGQVVNLPPAARYMGVRADNTGLISHQPGGMPLYAARSRIALSGALGGLGDVLDPSTVNGDTGSVLNTLTSPGVMPAINSEAVFVTNLIRGIGGQAPLSIAASSPALTVGVDPTTLLMIGGGILALFMFSKKRHGKRRK